MSSKLVRSAEVPPRPASPPDPPPVAQVELRIGVLVPQVCVPNAGLHVSPHAGCGQR